MKVMTGFSSLKIPLSIFPWTYVREVKEGTRIHGDGHGPLR